MLVPHSKGSVVTDSVLEFDSTNNTTPNITAVKDTFTEAIKTGNLTVDNTSISVIDITANGQCIFKDAFFSYYLLVCYNFNPKGMV